MQGRVILVALLNMPLLISVKPGNIAMVLNVLMSVPLIQIAQVIVRSAKQLAVYVL